MHQFLLLIFVFGSVSCFLFALKTTKIANYISSLQMASHLFIPCQFKVHIGHFSYLFWAYFDSPHVLYAGCVDVKMYYGSLIRILRSFQVYFLSFSCLKNSLGLMANADQILCSFQVYFWGFQLVKSSVGMMAKAEN